MPKFIAWVSTFVSGSECRDEFEIEDEELEGLTEVEQEEYITDVARDVINNLYEWGWKPIHDDD